MSWVLDIDGNSCLIMLRYFSCTTCGSTDGEIINYSIDILKHFDQSWPTVLQPIKSQLLDILKHFDQSWPTVLHPIKSQLLKRKGLPCKLKWQEEMNWLRLPWVIYCINSIWTSKIVSLICPICLIGKFEWCYGND